MNTETHYSILGVGEEATQDEIKKAYRKLAKENHPDKGGDEELFKKISVAYDVVGDENKRKQYDIERKNPFAGMGGGYGQSFNDLFNSMFNQTRQKPKAPTKNINLEISVLDSFLGIKKTVTYQRKVICEPCNGSGGDSKICQTCYGAGHITQRMGSGMFIQIVNVACPSCNGRGKFITNPCQSCNTSGSKDEIKNLEIKIPHGIDDGQFLRLQEMGDFSNGMYGDLILRIFLTKKDNFEKIDNHLIYHAYFTLDDLQKDSFIIPHPEGQLTVKFPNKFDTSKPLRVKGKGFKLNQTGDLMINQYVKYDRN
jgi:molecular chaperone DnaJ